MIWSTIQQRTQNGDLINKNGVYLGVNVLVCFEVVLLVVCAPCAPVHVGIRAKYPLVSGHQNSAGVYIHAWLDYG